MPAAPHRPCKPSRSSAAAGLSHDEAATRLAQHGRNSLPAARRRAPWLRFALQFHNPLIYVLLAAGAITFALDDLVDAGVILGVVLINALIGFVQEGKAEKALEAVSAMLASHATVRRGGAWQQIDAALLVPGDVVQLESGDRVPADLRLLRAKNLRIDEAALTGESVAADKDTEPVAEDAPIGDRGCMAYSGTVVSVGQAQGVVVATGRAHRDRPHRHDGGRGAHAGHAADAPARPVRAAHLAVHRRRRPDHLRLRLLLARPAAAGHLPGRGGPGGGGHPRRPARHRHHRAGHRHAHAWRATRPSCGACRPWRRWAR